MKRKIENEKTSRPLPNSEEKDDEMKKETKKMKLDENLPQEPDAIPYFETTFNPYDYMVQV